jgi:hypothetical protein
MNLLLMLSVPSLSAIVCMVLGITVQTLYPRLRTRPSAIQARVLVFPRRHS